MAAKRTVYVIVGGVAVLALVAAAAYAYAPQVFKHSGQSNTPTAQQPASKASMQQPASVNDLSDHMSAYNGKTVTVKGNLYQLTPGHYSLIGGEAGFKAVAVDISKYSGDISHYSNNPPTDQQKATRNYTVRGPFEVTGTVVDDPLPAHLLVQSIK